MMCARGRDLRDDLAAMRDARGIGSSANHFVKAVTLLLRTTLLTCALLEK